MDKSNYRLSRIFLTVPICSVYFQWYVFLISQNCNSKFASLGIHFRAPRGLNIIRLSRNGLNWDSWLILLDWPLIPACQLDQQDVINFTIFSLPFSLSPCIIQSWYIQSSFPVIPISQTYKCVQNCNSNFV